MSKIELLYHDVLSFNVESTRLAYKYRSSDTPRDWDDARGLSTVKVILFLDDNGHLSLRLENKTVYKTMSDATKRRFDKFKDYVKSTYDVSLDLD